MDDLHGPGLDKARELSPTVLGGDCLLILCGDRGPGKTQMATYWGREMAENNKKALYFKANKFLNQYRLEFDSDPRMKTMARETQRDAKHAALLILDEWSELAGSDWEMRQMTELIDERYDAMLATVIITNNQPAKAAEAVGRSIWSRAEQTGGVVVCDWPSYRKK